jgi:hypothetical protein
MACKTCGAPETFMGTNLCAACLDKSSALAPSPAPTAKRMNTYTLVLTDNGDGRTCTMRSTFTLTKAPRTRAEWTLVDKLGVMVNEAFARLFAGSDFERTPPDNAEELNYDEVKVGKYGPN